MIVTDQFVFLHLHKSGGTFVNECLMRFVPDARQIGYHLPRSLIPPEFQRLPVLGMVRNPWSYYVSWYAFQLGRPTPNALFQIVSNNDKLDFAATISNLTQLGRNPELLERLVAQLPREYGNRGLNLPGFALEALRGSSRGFYSFLHLYMFGEQSEQLRIGRMEALREDLLSMFREVEYNAPAELRAYILSRAPSNASRHAHYAEYYTPALRDLVAEADAEVIQKYGYAFGA